MHSFANQFWVTVQLAISSWAMTLRLTLILFIIPWPGFLIARAFGG